MLQENSLIDVRKYSVSWAVILSGYARTPRQIARLGYDNSEYIDFCCHDKLSNIFKEMIGWIHKIEGKKKESNSSAVAYEMGWKGDQKNKNSNTLFGMRPTGNRPQNKILVIGFF